MTNPQAIEALCVLASVRYAHMSECEQRTFLAAVMVVGPAAEAELAARALAARDEFEARQGELFEMFRAKHDGAGKGNGGAAP